MPAMDSAQGNDFWKRLSFGTLPNVYNVAVAVDWSKVQRGRVYKRETISYMQALANLCSPDLFVE